MKKRLGLIGCALVLGIGFSGCGLLDDEEKEAPEIELKSATSWQFAPGTTNEVTGEIDASEPIVAVDIVVVDANGGVVPTSLISVSYPTIVGVKSFRFTNKNFQISVGSTAPAGSYKMEIEVTVGELETVVKFPFTVTGGSTDPVVIGTPITQKTITAGANENTSFGSSIDLDAGVALLSSQVTNVADVDICYSVTGTGEAKIGTPFWANASQFNYAKNWTNPPSTKFFKTAMTKAEFDAITTEEQIVELGFVDGLSQQACVVAAGDVLIVKTSEGAISLVCLTDMTPGTTGSITIKSSLAK